MLQLTQNYKTGEVALADVAPPALRDGGILVRSAFSVISIGTELMKVREAKMNLIGKARARPDQLRQVLESARQQGVVATYHKVMNRLESLSPLGYSLSGIVEAVGASCAEFQVGQQVVCAGVSYANHAEVNYIPKNLAAAVPQGVSLEQASFATIGSIALHAFRQSELVLGEVAVVVGLGLVGQVLAQILKAAGVTVVGIDPIAERQQIARRCGVDDAGAPEETSWRVTLERLTLERGADCAFITVGADSNEPLELAAAVVRNRGRIIAVGKTKLNLDYNTFFKKEVDVRFSRSYGPGRYDRDYEENGHDYPAAYVRWTERRNLESVVSMLASGKLNFGALIDSIHPLADAVPVYESLYAGRLKGIGILFSYPPGVVAAQARSAPGKSPTNRLMLEQSTLRIGLIGAGNYACSMLLPHLARDKRVQLASLATTSSLSAENAKAKFGFERATTDHTSILTDDSIAAVVIATRHDSHSRLVCEALEAGKAVYVEKPMAIDDEGLNQIIQTQARTGNSRLMVGFNRRYSAIMHDAKTFTPKGPLTLLYRVHAGRGSMDSWISDPKQGTRFIGEAGHFFDVFAYFIEASAVGISATCLRPIASVPDDFDNVIATIRYGDGSIATLLYLTQGSSATPKEHLEIFGGGETAIIENFRELTCFNRSGRSKRRRGYGGDKGQKSAMNSFVACALEGRAFPVAFDKLVEITRLTLSAQATAVEENFLHLEQ